MLLRKLLLKNPKKVVSPENETTFGTPVVETKKLEKRNTPKLLLAKKERKVTRQIFWKTSERCHSERPLNIRSSGRSGPKKKQTLTYRTKVALIGEEKSSRSRV